MLLQTISNTASKATTINNDITVVKDWFTPFLVAGIIIFLGIVIQRIVIIYIQRIAKKSHWKGGLVLVSSLRGMIVLISILFGAYYGMTKAPIGEQTVAIAERVHNILVVFIITFVIARVLTGLLRAYSNREDTSKSSLSLFKSIINIIVYSLGL
jgi:hypothetical protein